MNLEELQIKISIELDDLNKQLKDITRNIDKTLGPKTTKQFMDNNNKVVKSGLTAINKTTLNLVKKSRVDVTREVEAMSKDINKSLDKAFDIDLTKFNSNIDSAMNRARISVRSACNDIRRELNAALNVKGNIRITSKATVSGSGSATGSSDSNVASNMASSQYIGAMIIKAANAILKAIGNVTVQIKLELGKSTDRIVSAIKNIKLTEAKDQNKTQTQTQKQKKQQANTSNTSNASNSNANNQSNTQKQKQNNQKSNTSNVSNNNANNQNKAQTQKQNNQKINAPSTNNQISSSRAKSAMSGEVINPSAIPVEAFEQLEDIIEVINFKIKDVETSLVKVGSKALSVSKALSKLNLSNNQDAQSLKGEVLDSNKLKANESITQKEVIIPVSFKVIDDELKQQIEEAIKKAQVPALMDTSNFELGDAREELSSVIELLKKVHALSRSAIPFDTTSFTRGDSTKESHTGSVKNPPKKQKAPASITQKEIIIPVEFKVIDDELQQQVDDALARNTTTGTLALGVDPQQQQVNEAVAENLDRIKNNLQFIDDARVEVFNKAEYVGLYDLQSVVDSIKDDLEHLDDINIDLDFFDFDGDLTFVKVLDEMKTHAAQTGQELKQMLQLFEHLVNMPKTLPVYDVDVDAKPQVPESIQDVIVDVEWQDVDTDKAESSLNAVDDLVDKVQDNVNDKAEVNISIDKAKKLLSDLSKINVLEGDNPGLERANRAVDTILGQMGGIPKGKSSVDSSKQFEKIKAQIKEIGEELDTTISELSNIDARYLEEAIGSLKDWIPVLEKALGKINEIDAQRINLDLDTTEAENSIEALKASYEMLIDALKNNNVKSIRDLLPQNEVQKPVNNNKRKAPPKAPRANKSSGSDLDGFNSDVDKLNSRLDDAADRLMSVIKLLGDVGNVYGNLDDVDDASFLGSFEDLDKCEEILRKLSQTDLSHLTRDIEKLAKSISSQGMDGSAIKKLQDRLTSLKQIRKNLSNIRTKAEKSGTVDEEVLNTQRRALKDNRNVSFGEGSSGSLGFLPSYKKQLDSLVQYAKKIGQKIKDALASSDSQVLGFAPYQNELHQLGEAAKKVATKIKNAFSKVGSGIKGIFKGTNVFGGSFDSHVAVHQAGIIKEKLGELKANFKEATGEISKMANKLVTPFKKITSILKNLVSSTKSMWGKLTSIFSKGANDAAKATEKLRTGLKDLLKQALGFLSLYGLINLGRQAIEQSQSLAQAEVKLASLMRQRMGATKETVLAIRQLAEEQAKLGVVSETAMKNGAQQLAMYVHSAKALETLMPAIANLTAKRGGFNATPEDAEEVATQLGEAIREGTTTPLEQSGIYLSESEIEKFKALRTEEERAAYLANVVAKNVGNINEALANTPHGAIAQLKNNFQSLLGTLGIFLANVIKPIVQWLNFIVVACNNALKALGNLLGFDMTGGALTMGDLGTGGGVGGGEIDTGGIDNTTDAYKDAADAADKATEANEKFKGSLMGFDEINVLSDKTDKGSDSTDPGGDDPTNITPGAGGQLIPSVGELTEGEGPFDKFAEKMKAFMDEVLEPFKNAWALLGDRWKAAWADLVESFKNFCDSLASFLKSVWDNGGKEFVQHMAEIALACGIAAMEIGGTILDALAKLWDHLDPEKNMHTQRLLDILNEVSVKLRDFILGLNEHLENLLAYGGQDVLNAMGDCFMDLAAAAVNAFGVIIDAVDGLIDHLDPKFNEDTRNMLQATADMFHAVGQAAWDFSELLKSALENGGQDMINAFGTCMVNLGETVASVITTMMESLSAFFEYVDPAKNEITKAMMKAWEDAFYAIGDAALQFAELFESVMGNGGQEVLNKLGDAFNSLVGLVGNVVKEIADSLNGLFEHLDPKTNEFTQNMLKAWQDAFDGIAELCSTIGEVLASAMDNGGQAVVNAIGDLGSQILETFGNIVEEVADCVGTLFKHMDPAENDIAKGAIESFEYFINSIRDFVGMLGNALGTFMDNGGQEFVNNMGDIIALLVDLGLTVTADLINAVTTFMDSWAGHIVISTCATALELISEVLKGLLEILEPLSPIISGVIAAFGGFMIAQKVVGFITTLVGAFKTLAGAGGILAVAKTAFTALWGVLAANPIAATVAAIVGIGAAIVALYNKCEGFREFIDGILEGFQDLFNELKEHFDTLLEDVRAIFGNVIDIIVGIFTGDGERVGEAVRNLIINLVNLAMDMNKAFVEVGWALIKGLVQGIWECIKALPSLLAGFCEFVVDFFKGLFGIHSPSTVFAELGVNLIEGLVKGITDMIGSVTEALGSIGEAITGWVGNIFSTVSESWTSICQETSMKWDEIKTAVSTKGQEIYEATKAKYEEVKTTVAENLEGLRQNSEEKWTEIKEKTGEIVSDLKTEAEEKYNEFKEKLTETLDKWRENSEEKWKKVQEKTNDIASKLKKEVEDKYTKFKDTLTNTLDKWRQNSEDKWTKIKNKTNDLTTKLRNEVEDRYNKFKENLTNTLDKLRQNSEDKWNKIKAKTEDITTNLKTTVEEKYNKFKENLTNTLDKWRQNSEDKWTKVKAKTEEITTNLKSTVESKYEEFKNNITSKLENLRSNSESKWNAIKSKTEELVNSFKSEVERKYNELKNNLASKLEEVKNETSAKWENIKTTTVTKVGAVVSEASTKYAEIKGKFTERMDELKSALGPKWDNLKSNAKTNAEGMVTKVSDGLRKLKDTITKPFNDAKDSVKKVISEIGDSFKNCDWKFPTLKLPKLKIEWKEDNSSAWFPGIKFPSFSWNARGGIIDGITPLGFANGQLQMGGEAGKEMVVPLENTSFTSKIAQAMGQAVDNAMARNANNMYGSNSNSNDSKDIVLKVNERELARASINSINKLQRESGRTLLDI